MARNRTATGAHFHFEPDSDRGLEISEWTCAKCVEEPQNGQSRKEVIR